MAVRRQGQAPTTHLLGSVAQEQDASAFSALFERYGPRIKGYLRNRGAADDLAEELLQEVMLTLWRTAERFDRSRSPAHSWIFLIARNKFIDSMRRQRARGGRNHMPLITSDMPAIEAPSEKMSEAAQMVQKAVQHLPAEQLEVLEMAYLQGSSATEISKALGVPSGTVKSRLRLALKRLREVVAEP